MAIFHNQPVDFVGMIGSTLESPLVIEGEQSNVEIGATDRPSLGSHCVKFSMIDNTSFLAISDNELLLTSKDHVTVAFAFSSISINTPADWGELWTVALGLSLIGFASPIEGKGTIIDGLCREYFNQYGTARVLEAEDMSDVVARCFEVVNDGNYFANINYRKNYPETGTDTMRIRISQRWTGVVIGEKTYSFSNPTGAITRYVEVGLIGYRTNLVPVPQDVYFTDFVVDYTNATYPLLDYDPSFEVTFNSEGGSSVSSQSVIIGGLVIEPSDPTREGYTFTGWYHDTECTNDWSFSTDTILAITTLYAGWEKIYIQGTGKWSIVLGSKQPSILLGGK
jgi:uncharacterized repeat protein (TIGR02543 family)